MTTNMKRTSLAQDRAKIGARRRRVVRAALARVGAYATLIGVAGIMLFPFLYMVAGALKTPEDTFNYPPRIFPRSPALETVNHVEEEIYVVNVPGVGDTSVYLAESGVPAGLFGVVGGDETEQVAWPLEFAHKTPESVELNGEVASIYNVSFGGERTKLVLVRETVVGRFVSLDDSTVETYAVARTAARDEFVDPRWSNFETIIELSDFDRSLTNTILVTVLIVGGTLFTSIMGGFAFSRINFPGRDKIFMAYMGSIMIPFVVLVVPLFRLMVSLGWVNSLGSLVWPFLFNAYGTFLLRQFFITIPEELEEAAMIDGASRWTILWRIYVPLSWPALATLSTFMFLHAWNSFVWPLVSINLGNSDDFVLTLALQSLNGQAGQGPNLVFAAIVLSVIIPFSVFALAQRYFVENASNSGLK